MTQRDRIVLGVLAAAAVIAGFWFVLLAPKREEASKLATDVSAAQQRVDAAQAKLVAAEAAKKDYSQQVLTLARLGKAVPTNDDMPSLVYQLQRTAENSGIDFRAVKVEAGQQGAAPAEGATAATGLQPMPFKLKFRGEFFDLRRFLDLVHSYTKPRGDTLDVKGRLMTVDGVSLSPGPDGFPQVTAEVVATAYTGPAADASGKGAAGAGATTPSTATPAGGATTAQSGAASTPPPAIVGGLLP